MSTLETVFWYAPVANVSIGQTILIKGRGHGVVRGILTETYKYLKGEGDSVHIDQIFRICLRFEDTQEGACLIPFRPTDFLLLPGWGTYMPRGPKEMPWQELH